MASLADASKDTIASKPTWKGPKGKPFIGVAQDLKRDPLGYFEELMLTYGDMVPFSIGPNPVVMLNHPDGIKHVLQDRYENYPKSRFYRSFKPILGRSIFMSSGQTWLKQRRSSSPSFGGSRFEFMAKQIAGATQTTVDRWDSCARQGKSVELIYEMMRLTLDGVTRALLDTHLEADYERLHHALTAALRETERHVWSPIHLPMSLIRVLHPRYHRAIRDLDEIIWEVIEQRRQHPSNDGGLLNLLIDHFKRDHPHDQALLRDQVMAMLVTGHESTSCALAWTLFLLMEHPEEMAIVRAEIETVLGDRTAGLEDLPKLERLSWAFEEALRLYPPVWTISRMAQTDDQIMGMPIKKGTTVMLCPYAVHRHPEYWPEPHRFRPTRFSPEERDSRPRYAYFPFALGPRVCLGNRFAMMEGKIMLSMLLQNFDLSLVPGQDTRPVPMVTLRPINGFHTMVQRRAA